ncbi:MAG: hypothetical protein EPO21_13135 [Chloroflexota bacterium]|nr:MAG: hypothetical protein EPO21_13135 [Chloroflexota bacterium]
MNYPAPQTIIAWAAQNNAQQLPVFAFAADNGRVPYTIDELQGFIQNVVNFATVAWGQPDQVDLVYAYLQANGELPDLGANRVSWRNWITGNGYAYIDSSNVFRWSGKRPYGGLNYPPGGIVTPPTVPTTPTPIASKLGGGLSFSQAGIEDWVTRHPTLALGLGALLWLSVFGMPKLGRRR